MTRVVKNRFQRILEAKRDDLLREIGELRQRLAIHAAGDSMDQVHSVADRDFAIRALDRKNGVLHMVEGAMREIALGTFGECERCGEEIPPRRLQAMPWSPYCVACQERLEKNGRTQGIGGGRARAA